jgi:hypothetical protein
MLHDRPVRGLLPSREVELRSKVQVSNPPACASRVADITRSDSNRACFARGTASCPGHSGEGPPCTIGWTRILELVEQYGAASLQAWIDNDDNKIP